jgi:hypothetical protein
MRACIAVALAALAAALVPGTGRASFHEAVIDEVMSGVNGNPAVQFVEIRMLSTGQTMVGNTRLTAFSCDGSSVQVLLLVPGPNLPSTAGSRWIMATPSFAAAACITPDFTFTPPGGHPGIFPSCGMVCWGAPGMEPPPPASWDFTNPLSYVDCVAYGPYTGPLPMGSPAASTPGSGTQSLTRNDITGNDADDFALAAPTPTNKASQTGSFGGMCAATTTTSTVTTPTVTTTTFPAGAGQRLEGKKLSLKTKPTDPEKQGVTALAKDPSITLGDGNGSADDPTLTGGSLRVVTTSGDAFDVTFDLPADGWQLMGKPGANKGYKFRSTGPVSVVLVKRGKLVKAVVKGGLGLSLLEDPDPVRIVVTTGAERYCMSFGGTVVFDAERKFLAKDAPAPAACGP